MIANLLVGAILSQTVTVEASAKSLDDVLSQVSAQGTRLVAGGSIGADMIAVRVNKVPLATFMDKVASVTLGTWEPIEGGYRLTRDSAKWSQAIKNETSQRTAAVREAIVNFAEPTTKQNDFTAESARKLGEALREASSKLAANPTAPNVDWASLQGRSPGDRLLARVLLSVDPADFANMFDGERQVWSSRPNRLQRPLGASVPQALARFLDESRTWQDNKPQGLEVDALGSFGIAAHWATGSIRPTRVLMIASSWTTYSFYNVELKLLDDAGREVTGTSTTFSLGQSSPGKEERFPPASAGEPTLQLSKDSLVLRALKSRSTADLPAEVRKQLLNPESGDPYLKVGSEVLEFLAGDQPYLAVLTDTMAPVLDAVPHQAQKNAAKWVLERSSITKLEESDGWITLTPKFPVSARAHTLNRASLGPLLKEMDRRGGPSIEHLVTLSRTPACHSPLLVYWIQALFSDTSNSHELGTWDVYRLYDALQPSLGKAEDVTIQVGRINENAQRRLAHLLYYSVYGSMSFGFPTQAEDITVDMDHVPTSEPTEVWPNGLPNNLLLSVSRSEGTALVGVGSDYGPTTPEELGSQLAMRERPDVFPWMTEMPMAAKYVVVGRRQVNIGIAMKPEELLGQFSLTDLTRTDGKEYVLGSLPEAIQRIINTSRDESRKLYSGLGVPPTQGGNIPPLTTP